MTTPTVLVLDPHRELAEMAGEVLAAGGFNTVVEEHFGPAVATLDARPDIQLAVCHATLLLDGEQRQVRILDELDRRGHIALVVISSRPFEDIPNIPERAVLLQKPFGARELLDAVAQASSTVPTPGPARPSPSRA